MESIGRKIKSLRVINNYSQESLGKELNIDRSMISRWENDAVMPSEDNLQHLCALFHVDRSYFDLEATVDEDLEMRPEKKTIAADDVSLDSSSYYPLKESLIVIVLGILNIYLSPLSLPLSIYNTYYSIKKKCHPIIIFFAIFGILYFINDICFIFGHDFFPRINFYYRSGD